MDMFSNTNTSLTSGARQSQTSFGTGAASDPFATSLNAGGNDIFGNSASASHNATALQTATSNSFSFGGSINLNNTNSVGVNPNAGVSNIFGNSAAAAFISVNPTIGTTAANSPFATTTATANSPFATTAATSATSPFATTAATSATSPFAITAATATTTTTTTTTPSNLFGTSSNNLDNSFGISCKSSGAGASFTNLSTNATDPFSTTTNDLGSKTNPLGSQANSSMFASTMPKVSAGGDLFGQSNGASNQLSLAAAPAHAAALATLKSGFLSAEEFCFAAKAAGVLNANQATVAHNVLQQQQQQQQRQQQQQQQQQANVTSLFGQSTDASVTNTLASSSNDIFGASTQTQQSGNIFGSTVSDSQSNIEATNAGTNNNTAGLNASNTISFTAQSNISATQNGSASNMFATNTAAASNPAPIASTSTPSSNNQQKNDSDKCIAKESTESQVPSLSEKANHDVSANIDMQDHDWTGAERWKQVQLAFHGLDHTKSRVAELSEQKSSHENGSHGLRGLNKKSNTMQRLKLHAQNRPKAYRSSSPTPSSLSLLKRPPRPVRASRIQRKTKMQQQMQLLHDRSNKPVDENSEPASNTRSDRKLFGEITFDKSNTHEKNSIDGSAVDADNKKTNLDSQPLWPTSRQLTTTPSLDELRHYTSKQLARVHNFTVQCDGVGKVSWPGLTDVRHLNLDQAIQFSKDSKGRSKVAFYSEMENAESDLKTVLPNPGQGLNKHCVITLIGFQPSTKRQVKKMQKRIARATEQIGGELIDYATETGAWTFALQHVC